MAAGQILSLPLGDFEMDIIVPPQGVRVLGSGRSASDGLTMSGGTIVRGEIVIANSIGAEVGYVGVNQVGLPSASYPNAVTGGLTTTSSTTVVDQYVHDVCVLGRGFGSGANSQHGVLLQNGRGFLVERCIAWNFLNSYISRASGAVISRCYSYDADQQGFLIKSASAGGANDAYDNVIENCVAVASGAAAGAKSGANYLVLSEDGANRVCVNNKIKGCTAFTPNFGQAAFSINGSGASTGNVDVLVEGCTSRNANYDVFLVNDVFSDRIKFVGCHSQSPNGFGFRTNNSAPRVVVTRGCTFVGNGAFGTFTSSDVNGVIT